MPMKSACLSHDEHLARSAVQHAFLSFVEFTRGRAKRVGRAAAVAAILLAFGANGAAAAADLPTGGAIVAGSGTIAQTGKTMTVTQSTNRMAADWQSFSIGAGNTVNFVQPSASAVALNRVLGADVSVIQGALNANGQVFLVNPNGVLFTPTAQVNVGGLVATTLNIARDDFMAGNYRFSGDSVQGVRNEGTLKASPGGTVALIAARVENIGSIEAPQGNVLLAAGQRVLLDLGGPVKLEVQAGALDALIEQGGAISADGGRVYLTAQAAGELASSVINHTGIIEARTLATGEKGEIVLMGDRQAGSVNVGGTLDASAPQGGDGGFIETSAAKVSVSDTARITTAAVAGQTGTWLIDPQDYTIAASGGDMTGTQLGTNLGSNNVTIQSADGAGGTGGDIFVNQAVTWATANTLTLNAWRNININANVSASQGTLKLYYGQGAINNSMNAVNPSRVYIDSAAAISLSAGNHYYTKLGSDGEETAWTVITALGNATSSNDGTLQGINGVRDRLNRIAGNFVLGADIDATATQGWNSGKGFMPLGLTGLANVFTGRFDGLGHTINKIYINRPNESYVGLFGITDPTNGATYTWTGSPLETPQMANLRLTNLTVVGGSTTGGLAGELRNSAVSNIFASGTVYSTSSRIGGLVGNNKYGMVLNSYSTVNVTGGSGIGGLVGEFEVSANLPAYITNSYASGTVSKVNWWSSNCGGLIGRMGWDPEVQGVVTNSYYNTSVNTDASMVDRSAYGLSAANLTAAAQANWSASIWNTSGALPTLKKFIAIPVYRTPVAGVSNPDGDTTTYVTYTLGWLEGSYEYKGEPYELSELWSSGTIFGSGYAGWVANTDYVFTYKNSAVTGFTNAGNYYGIGITVLKSGYALGRYNTKGTLYIDPRPITVTVDSKSKTYGDADPALTYQITEGSLVGSDSLSGDLLRGEGEYVGNYDIDAWGLSNSNYAITANNGILTINPRPITVTTDPQSKIYGAADPAFTYQITAGSLVEGDSLWGEPSRPAGENVGNYAIDASTLANDNYLITAVNGNLTIDPRPISVTVSDKSKTYGAVDPALTYQVTAGSLVGSDTLALTRAAGENVGNYAISPSALANGNYAITAVNGTLTIDPRPITVTADNKSKTYGNVDPALTYQVTAGSLVTGDSLSGSLTRAAGENVGNYAIDASGLANGNYLVTALNGILTIDPRPITVTADGKGKIYGNVDPALTYQVTAGSLVNGDSLSGSLTRAAGENVGNYAINASALANGNYLVTAVNGTLTIDPRPITVTADAKNKTYGNADPALTYQVTAGSLVNGDSLSGSLTRAAGENVGNYAIDASGLANGNYLVTALNGTLTIDPRPITVTADGKGKIYGNVDPALTYQVTAGSLVNGDSLSGSLTRAAGENVGNYAINASALANGNYLVTAVNGILTIDPRPITVTADGKGKIYGNVDPALTYQVTAGSLVNGDSLSGSLTRAAGENVGNYAINASALANGNYLVTAVNGILTIDPRPITVTADGKGKIYGNVDPALTYQVTAGSLVNGDSLSGSLTRAAGENVGNYAIDASALYNGNYLVTALNGTLTIDPRPVTVTDNPAITIVQQIAGGTGNQPGSFSSGPSPSGAGFGGGSLSGSGGLTFVEVSSLPGQGAAGGGASGGGGFGNTGGTGGVGGQLAGVDPFGFVRVLVVNGGINWGQ